MESSLSLILLPIYFMLTQGISVPVDTGRDLSSMWKVKGPWEYVEEASSLRGPLSEYFPDRFEFAHLDLTKGVWALVPTRTRNCQPQMDSAESSFEKFSPTTETSWTAPKDWSVDDAFNSKEVDDDDDDETTPTSGRTTRSTTESSPITKPMTEKVKPICYTSSNATFQFTLTHQMTESATIRYCFGGNAVIHVGGAGQEPFEMMANGKHIDTWIEEKVPLKSRTMTLEAFVYGKGDYVLIDRVAVEFLTSASTTPRPGQFTTEKPSNSSTESPPEPAPASGQARTGLVSIISLMPFFMLIVQIFSRQM